jgi:hypothetical protein
LFFYSEKERDMKIHNIGGKLEEGAKGHAIVITPDTNGPKTRSLRVALSREFGGEVPERADVGKVGAKKDLLMLFPEKRQQDDRHLVIAGFPRPGHRRGADINKEETTATILDQSHGYGAFGSGVAFIAVLEEGQRVVSNTYRVIWAEDGEVRNERFTQAEYIEYFKGIKDDDVELI